MTYLRTKIQVQPLYLRHYPTSFQSFVSSLSLFFYFPSVYILIFFHISPLLFSLFLFLRDYVYTRSLKYFLVLLFLFFFLMFFFFFVFLDCATYSFLQLPSSRLDFLDVVHFTLSILTFRLLSSVFPPTTNTRM